MISIRRRGYLGLAVLGIGAALAISTYGCSPEGDPPAPYEVSVSVYCLAARDVPAVYVLDSRNVTSFIGDNLGLYWTSDTGVWMLPKGAAIATQLDTDARASYLTTDGDYVYWVFPLDGRARWFDRGTSRVSSAQLLGRMDYASVFAMDARYFYGLSSAVLTDRDAGFSATTGRIQRTPLRASGPVETIYTAPVGHTFSSNIELHAANSALYWIDIDGLEILPNGASSPTLLAAFEGTRASTLKVDERGAYWLSQILSTATLIGLPFDGSPTVPLTTLNAFDDIMMDHDFIYFSRSADSSPHLSKIDRSTFVVSPAGSSDIVGARFFAVDHDDVYWIDSCDKATIRRTAK